MDINQIKYVKENTDIVDVIGRFVQLKQKGVNYVGLSPFTSEKTPSFTVSRNKNMFKCFASGKHGDVIDFIMLINKCKYNEALAYLGSPQAPTDYKYIAPPEIPVSYIDAKIMYKSISPRNNFIAWLTNSFSEQKALECMRLYYVGSSNHVFRSEEFPEYKSETGACVFWQIDKSDNVRSGKILLYNVDNGKRVKIPFPHINWVHKLYKNGNRMFPDFNMSTCLFGEHLLKLYPNKDVALVESEKSAIVASLVYPQYLWLASGSLTNISLKRCECLIGRNVTLYPDVGGEVEWDKKRKELAIYGDWKMHTLTGPKGFDICDQIIEQLKK